MILGVLEGVEFTSPTGEPGGKAPPASRGSCVGVAQRWPKQVMAAERSRSLAVSKSWYCMSHSTSWQNLWLGGYWAWFHGDTCSRAGNIVHGRLRALLEMAWAGNPVLHPEHSHVSRWMGPGRRAVLFPLCCHSCKQKEESKLYNSAEGQAWGWLGVNSDFPDFCFLLFPSLPSL